MKEIIAITKTVTTKAIFLLMPMFTIIHSLIYVEFEINNRMMNLNFINQVYTMLIIILLYIWAFLCSEKRFVQVMATITSCLSVCCLIMSLPNLGPSLNDMLQLGSSILMILYVIYNSENIKKYFVVYKKYIQICIVLFLVFSAFLFTFFYSTVDVWGEGTFIFGHRYAAVLFQVLMLLWILISKEKNKKMLFSYWILILLLVSLTMFTGVRTYGLVNMALCYGIALSTFSKPKKILVSFVVLTLIFTAMTFNTPFMQKSMNIVEDYGEIAINDKNDIMSEIVVNEKSDRALDLQIYELLEFIGDDSWGSLNHLSNGRLNMWVNICSEFQKLPLSNQIVGTGNEYLYRVNNQLTAHNDFLNILMFNGAIGLLLYLFIFLFFVPRYWLKNNYSILQLIIVMGVWGLLASVNGYAAYTSVMISLPYALVCADIKKTEDSKLT